MVKYNVDRDENTLVEIRPLIILESFDGDSDLELFQNETLRPILKLQHNILIDFLLSQPKIESVLKQKEIRRIFESKLKDYMNQPQLKGQLIGMVTGHFTTAEMKFYVKQSKDINKRIFQMLLQRFVDSL